MSFAFYSIENQISSESEGLNELRIRIITECKNKENVTDADISPMQLIRPTTEKAKCFGACTIEKLGIVIILEGIEVNRYILLIVFSLLLFD